MRRRPAFTLLELLIASSLLALLMLLVWSLFSTYTRLEERGARAASELQLMRSVSQQLRSDIEHLALPVPIPARQSKRSEKQREQSSETDVASSSSTFTNGKAVSEALADSETVQDTLGQTDPPSPLSSVEIVPSLQLDLGEAPQLDSNQLNQPKVFDSSLLVTTYFRGSATRLELVIRQPYTVDVPTGNQLLGSETRYGTHQYVIYEWRGARDLAALLSEDPVLNPAKFVPPPPTPIPPASMSDPLTLPEPVVTPTPTPTRLNPNDNVGLIREAKSWLHVTRDQRREALQRQANAAGLLVDGKFPWELPSQPQDLPRPLIDVQVQGNDGFGDPRQSSWMPPSEFRHKRDHVPEITRLQFRYFNGASWQLDWTDASKLPTAIEVAFDLDCDAPAARAKEFEDAHNAMLGGAALESVLPKDEGSSDEASMNEAPLDLDSLSSINMLDPTAIASEYRFVMGLPRGPEKESSVDRDEQQELSFALEEDQ